MRGEHPYRHATIPAQLFTMVEVGKITTQEGWLLALIDAMDEPPSSGCCLTDVDLAVLMGATDAWMEQKIRQLLKKRLLVDIGVGGENPRQLIVSWNLGFNVTCSSAPYSNSIPREGWGLYGGPLGPRKAPLPGRRLQLKKPDTNIPPQQTRSRRCHSHIHARWQHLAELLHHAVFEHTKVDRTRHLRDWANQLRLLHARDKVAITRIRAVLRWYASQFPNPGKFIPQAFSGGSFRGKFVKLEAAMRRELQDDTGEQPPAYKIRDGGELSDEDEEGLGM